MALIASDPIAPPPRPPIDAQDVRALTTRLITLADELNDSAGDCAQARAVREMSGDRLKRALAVHMRQSLLDNESAAKAEALARSSERYGRDLDRLQNELATANAVIAAYESKRIQWEAVRSSLSSAKHAADTY